MEIAGGKKSECGGLGLAPGRFRHIQFLSENDHVLPGALASAALVRPATAANPRRTLERDAESVGPEAKKFITWVLDSTGVDPRCYRWAPLGRRLQACLRSLRSGSIAEARDRLVREPDTMPTAVNSLLIGVTQFFRDPAVFGCLENTVLPRLAAKGVGLRVWSAGCADGAELYSVAMLLANRGILEGCTLLGTDCRVAAIHEAERGWFDSTRLDGLDPRLRQAYFVETRGGAGVCERLRRCVRWQQGNLLDGPPHAAGDWDLVLCRNLAIYLEPEAVARLWSVLTASLRVGGVFVVGKAERPEGHSSLVRLAPCIFEKQR